MRHRKLPTNSVTHPGLMALKAGVAWVGCPDEKCKTEIAIKKCEQFEYEIQKAAQENFPSIVPKVYDGVRCFDGFYMYSEYMPEGTLKQNKKPELVLKTLMALKKIRAKFPEFRHNDLHVDNVLVKGDRPYIYDFGFANWPRFGTNPITKDQILMKDFGIFPGNHPMYDVHFFVNSVSADFPEKFKKVALSVFPKEYIGENSPVVKNWRLRWDVTHKDLPTMDQVIAAFSSLGNKKNMKPLFPKLRTMNLSSPAPKKKKSPAAKKKASASPAVKFSLANKRKVSNRKAELLRRGNFNNNVQAELQAIRNITKLKKAGLLTPSPSPVKGGGVMGAGGGFAPSASRKSNSPSPVLVFTTTPQRRPRINGKLCTSYKKEELMRVLRRMGHRVTKDDTMKQMCAKLRPPTRGAALLGEAAKATRPTVNAVVDVRKKTYAKYLKKNLYRLAKNVGLKATPKDKKQDLVNRLYGKLNRNVNAVIGGTKNKSTLTARHVAETLAKHYGWKDDRHVERLRILKIYANK